MTRVKPCRRARACSSSVGKQPSTSTTAEHPVRIDQWGDEVERLSHFAVTDQRSTHVIDAVTIFPCRELLPTDEVRARAAEGTRLA